MLFSKAKGHKVVSSSTAGTVGKVSGFVVDPGSRSVVALRLKKTQAGDTLRWSDLSAFGAAAVTVSDGTLIAEPDDEVKALSGKGRRLLGKRVLTTGGDELGKLDDVDFDPESGALTALLVSDGSEVAASRLLGVGSYAVVVQEEA